LLGFDLDSSDQMLEMGVTEKFALESTVRSIDACTDIEELKGLTKSLYSAWLTTRMMLKREMFNSLPPPLSDYLEAKQLDYDSIG
jgi:hypothetical protein